MGKASIVAALLLLAGCNPCRNLDKRMARCQVGADTVWRTHTHIHKIPEVRAGLTFDPSTVVVIDTGRLEVRYVPVLDSSGRAVSATIDARCKADTVRIEVPVPVITQTVAAQSWWGKYGLWLGLFFLLLLLGRAALRV